MQYQALKILQREESHKHSAVLGFRVHHASSWLDRTEQGVADQNRGSILSRIAVDSPCNSDTVDLRLVEGRLFSHSIDRLVDSDDKSRFASLVWQKYLNVVSFFGFLLDNQHEYKPLGNHQNSADLVFALQTNFTEAESGANRLLDSKIFIECSALYSAVSTLCRPSSCRAMSL